MPNAGRIDRPEAVIPSAARDLLLQLLAQARIDGKAQNRSLAALGMTVSREAVDRYARQIRWTDPIPRIDKPHRQAVPIRSRRSRTPALQEPAMTFRNAFLPLALVVAFAGAAPAGAQQRLSTNDRLAALEQQLAASRDGNVALLNQIDALRRETQALRAQLEELQEAQRKRDDSARIEYLDIDSRLARLESGAAAPTPPVAPTPTATPGASVPATRPPTTSVAPAVPAARPPSAATGPAVQDSAPRVYGDAATLGKAADERSAYTTAFDALKAGRYAESARLFQGFLGAYPNGAYAPNALYWLGESYYVTQNYALAEEEFRSLLDRYPTHDKAPGALLKIGLAQYGLRQLDAAEATLAQVIARYPGSEAARTADDRLRAIQLARVR
jgi:tol-pal system protein YbgF